MEPVSNINIFASVLYSFLILLESITRNVFEHSPQCFVRQAGAVLVIKLFTILERISQNSFDIDIGSVACFFGRKVDKLLAVFIS